MFGLKLVSNALFGERVGECCDYIGSRPVTTVLEFGVLLIIGCLLIMFFFALFSNYFMSVNFTSIGKKVPSSCFTLY